MLHEELQRHFKPAKNTLADIHSTFLELNERLEKENLYKKGYSAAANTVHIETSIKGSLKAAKGAKRLQHSSLHLLRKGSSKRKKGSNSVKKSSKSTKKSSGSSEKGCKKTITKVKTERKLRRTKSFKAKSKAAKKASDNEKKASKAKASKAKSKLQKKLRRTKRKLQQPNLKQRKRRRRSLAKSRNTEIQLSLDKALRMIKRLVKLARRVRLVRLVRQKKISVPQSTNTIAPTPCCSICAADFLPPQIVQPCKIEKILWIQTQRLAGYIVRRTGSLLQDLRFFALSKFRL